MSAALLRHSSCRPLLTVTEPLLPQGRIPLGCAVHDSQQLGAFGTRTAGFQGIHPASAAIVRLMDAKRYQILTEI